MSLREFVHHPIASELIQNGQTLQILGITNYSHWSEAGELRRCFKESEVARSQLTSITFEIMEKFSHVGVTKKCWKNQLWQP